MKYVLTLSGIVCLCLMSLPACTPQAEQAEPAAEEASSTEADVAAIEELLNKEIGFINDGDVEGLLTLVTDDTIWMPPNEPVIFGKDALQSWIQDFFSQVKIELSGQAEEVHVSGDWAFQRYSMTMMMTPAAGGDATQESGKGIHIYQKQSDGTWKLARDVWNTDSPLPG